jgi:hypothetical protein
MRIGAESAQPSFNDLHIARRTTSHPPLGPRSYRLTKRVLDELPHARPGARGVLAAAIAEKLAGWFNDPQPNPCREAAPGGRLVSGNSVHSPLRSGFLLSLSQRGLMIRDFFNEE